VLVFCSLFLIIISALFAVTSVSVCVLLDSTTLWHLPLHIPAWACVCTICLWFQCLRLCIFSNENMHKLYHVSLNIRSSPKRGIPTISDQ
jgi:hypothetical protein